MARNKPRAKKLRLSRAARSSVAAPFWAILKTLGKRKTHRWRLNPGERRSWKKNKLKK